MDLPNIRDHKLPITITIRFHHDAAEASGIFPYELGNFLDETKMKLFMVCFITPHMRDILA